jgi:hypothetical protein
MGHTFRDDQGLQFPLFIGFLHDLFLYGIFAHEPKYQYWFRLANPVGSVLGLDVHLWILQCSPP